MQYNYLQMFSWTTDSRIKSILKETYDDDQKQLIQVLVVDIVCANKTFKCFSSF